MKIVIIEDEDEAAERLERLVSEVAPGTEVLAVLDSIESAVEWINNNAAPDLYLMDIHLADGASFEIFKDAEVLAPVIFTTAYDQYAIEAFKVNSIDYLLKPIKKEDLQQAIDKFKQLFGKKEHLPDVDKILNLLQPDKKDFQKRIMVRYGSHIKVFDLSDIAYFFTQEKVNFLCTFNGQRLPVDHSLDELELMLEPIRFFRVNRQFIVSFPAIDQMITYPKARVKMILKPACDMESIVSSERSAAFKEWLLGK